MINEQILSYVRNQLAQGVSKEKIAADLGTQGWTPADIDEALRHLVTMPPPITTPPPIPPVTPVTTATPAPSVTTPAATTPTLSVPAPRRMRLSAKLVAAVCVGVFVAVGVGYAYVQKLGPFARPPYSQNNLISGLLATAAGMRSASVSAAVSFTVVPREADAKPFVSKLSGKKPNKDPFLTELGGVMALLPVDASAGLTFTSASEFSEESSRWKASVDAFGDLGDLVVKFNAEALKTDTDYYFRINNIPTLFGSYFSSIKGIWVQVPASSTSALSSSYARDFAEFEQEYKANSAKLRAAVRKVARIADEERMLAFAQTPRTETVGGRLTYRYDLELRRGAILAVYKRILSEVIDRDTRSGKQVLEDKSIGDYLASPEFGEIMDYYDANTKFTLWVDARGYPAAAELTLRIVPSDKVFTLKDKQGLLVWRAEYSDINKPVMVEAPKDAKLLDTLIKDIEKSFNIR